MNFNISCILNHLFRWIPSAAKTMSKRRMRWKERDEYFDLVRDLVVEAIVDYGFVFLLANTKFENEHILGCSDP